MPDFGGAYDIRVRLRRVLAQIRGFTDPAAARALHQASLADIDTWAELQPGTAGPLEARAGVLFELASLPGQTPAATEAGLRKALESIDASLALLDAMRPRLQRVLICTLLGRTVVAGGRDATEFFDAALAGANRLLDTTPGLAAALVARGTVRFDRARFRIPAGGDPRAEVDGAIADLTEAIKTLKADVNTLVVLGQAHLTRAQMERDPAAQRKDLEQCLALTDRAIAINPAVAPQLKPFADALRAQLGAGK
jgi:hypothetical protein